MGDFLMPSLGADMHEGTLVEWLVAPGDEVGRGQLVAVVDTDKASIEVETFESGRVGELLVEPGTTVAVGTPLARIETTAPDETTAPEVEAPTPDVAAPTAPRSRSPVVHPGRPPATPGTTSPLVRHLAERAHVNVGSVQGTGVGGTVTRADVEHVVDGQRRPRHGRVPASPFARRLAGERGIDLASTSGHGPGGAVVATDVLAAERSAAAPRPGPVDRQANVRRATAEVVARSKREIPHYYLSTSIDLHATTAWLEQHNEPRPPGERVLPAAVLLKAVALAARKVPDLNGTWDDEGLHRASSVHLGVAVSLRGGGLLAPVIHDADHLGIDELMVALRDLVGRTRAGRVRRDELADGTITVTNLGEQGVDVVQGIIQPPQVALVGFGRIAERPWAVDGMLAVRPVVVASLAADHRATDGRTGAQLLDLVDQLLQAPDVLAEGGTP
jgi:pyruvate dehydrogenase E2 component (dihydrolipoamide acetyltransferase)